jgi:dCTP deaminase
MTLSKKEIIEFIKQDKMSFDPVVDTFQIQPNSLDLRLGWNFYIPKNWTYEKEGRLAKNVDYLDFDNSKNNFDLIKLKPGQYFEILPKEFVIASTLEKVSFKDNDLMAILYARSSFIRRGLLVESGVIDIKYSGNLALPIINNTNNQIIRLYPGERVCQLVFHTTSSGLTDDEAQKHGVIGAKYEQSAPYSLEAKSDSNEEVELIKGGKLEELKKVHGISLSS